MSDDKILESLLDETPQAWKTANLIQQHYAKIVIRRANEHFSELAVRLKVRLEEEFEGEWCVTNSGKWDKALGCPLQIRRTDWRADNALVIAFEYSADTCSGNGRFGLINLPVPGSKEYLNIQYPRKEISTPPTYDRTNWWLAFKEIKDVPPPDFISVEQLLEGTKEIIDHFDVKHRNWLTDKNSHLDGDDNTVEARQAA